MTRDDSPLAAEIRRVVREEIAAALVPTDAAAERVFLADVAAHGAPSAQWVRDRRRENKIEIHGPRGRQYVMLGALRALLAATFVRRRPSSARAAVEPGAGTPAETSLEDDVSAAVAELAARPRTNRRRTA